jgi:diguanylate cyclase (GGDEF)-like protein
MKTIHNIKNNIEDMEKSIQHATEMSIQDPITLLGNCKYFEMSFDGELYTLKRYKIPVSLMLLRMKNLTQVKEKYGAAVERSVIKNLAKIIYENIRSSDMLFRCDNGDFRILMHNTDAEKAQIFAQKIKYLINRVVFQKNEDRFRINILYGTAQMREKDTIESILMRITLKN